VTVDTSEFAALTDEVAQLREDVADLQVSAFAHRELLTAFARRIGLLPSRQPGRHRHLQVVRSTP
jgi:hypothetical protein